MTRRCSIDGCGKKLHSHGFCGMHNARWKRHCDPLGGKPKQTRNGELLAFLEGNKTFDGPECLTWPFGKSSNGHGQIRYRNKQMSAAHVMCILAHGEPPTPEHETAHSCGKGHLACVHPGHVRWATESQNQLDRRIHGTDQRGSRHHCAILTEAAVANLRERMLGHSKQYKRVADELGLSATTIRRAVLGITWKHI